MVAPRGLLPPTLLLLLLLLAALQPSACNDSSSSDAAPQPSIESHGSDVTFSDPVTSHNAPAEAAETRDPTPGKASQVRGGRKPTVSGDEEAPAAPSVVKRSIGSLARQNAFSWSPQAKRSLSSLTRQSSSRWYSKKSLASLARGASRGGLGEEEREDLLLGGGLGTNKRHIGSFARLTASRFHGPKRTLASLVGHGSLFGSEHDDKRGLPSIARQGHYGETSEAQKRALASIARQGGFSGMDDIKRSLSSIARQGGFVGGEQGKRGLSSLARQGVLFGGERDIRLVPMVAQQGGLSARHEAERRSLSSVARQGGYATASDERDPELASLANQGLYGEKVEKKRSIAAIARLGGFGQDGVHSESGMDSDVRQIASDDDLEKRGLSSIARHGGLHSGDIAEKRGLSSIARQGGFAGSVEKRTLASVARQGGFDDGVSPRAVVARYPSYADEFGEFSDQLADASWPGPYDDSDWDVGGGLQKRYMAALARMAPQHRPSMAFWAGHGLVGSSRSIRSAGPGRQWRAVGSEEARPASPRAVPSAANGTTDTAPGEVSSEEVAMSPKGTHSRKKRRAGELYTDFEKPLGEDNEDPADWVSAQALSTVKRHLGSLVRAYMLPPGHRSGWMSRYGRAGAPRPARSGPPPRAY